MCRICRIVYCWQSVPLPCGQYMAIFLINWIAARVCPGGLGRGSSMPDIKSNLPNKSGLPLFQSSNSILPRTSGPLDPAPRIPSELVILGHWIGLKVLISPELAIKVESSKALGAAGSAREEQALHRSVPQLEDVAVWQPSRVEWRHGRLSATAHALLRLLSFFPHTTWAKVSSIASSLRS